MRQILFAAMLSVSTSALADQYVRPHVRADGTYVEGHYRSSPNSSRYDNYSSQGNTNPYTGQRGHESPYPAPTIQAPRVEMPTLQNPYDTSTSRRRGGW